MDNQNFQQYLSNLQTVNSVPQQPEPIQQPAPQASTAAPAASGGSWWHKLLPAAGGVLGGILGGAADVATLGLAAPLINPITGAALGGAVGQMGSNALEGKKVLEGNVLTSAAENAIGGAVGGAATKVVGALGRGIAGAGAKAGNKAAATALENAAASKSVSDATATKLNFGGISPKVANDLELGKGQKFVRSMGYDPTNPYDMQKVANGVGEMNNVYDRALAAAPEVKMGDFNKKMFDVLKSNGNTDMTTTPVGQALADFGKQAGIDMSAGVPEKLSAVQVRQLQQAVGRQIGNTQMVINNAELNGMYNTEAQSNLRTLQDIYQQLGTRVKTPEVNKAIQGFTVTDADRQGLIAKYGDKLGAHIADSINNAKSADDLLNPMQQLTKMGHASKLAIDDIENVTNSARAEARAKFEATGGVMPGGTPAPSTALELAKAGADTIRHPVSAVIKAGVKAHEAGLTPKVASAVGNVLQRTAPLMTPVSIVGSNIPNMSANTQPAALPAGTEGDQAMQPAAAMGAGGAPVNPVNSELSLLNSLISAAPTVLGPQLAPTAAGLTPTVQQNAMAGNALSSLPSTYANAGGAQGLGGGLISSLLSHVPGTAANTYKQQQLAAAAQLAKALGISPEAALAMLPQLAQTPQIAAPQQQATMGLLGQLTAGLPATAQ